MRKIYRKRLCNFVVWDSFVVSLVCVVVQAVLWMNESVQEIH